MILKRSVKSLWQINVLQLKRKKVQIMTLFSLSAYVVLFYPFVFLRCINSTSSYITTVVPIS